MRTSESISNISAALSNFQSIVKHPKKDSNNPYFNSKYVPLEGLVSVITEPLSKSGLSYIQSTGTEGELVTITTLLMHTSGEFIESDPLKLPGHQAKKNGEKDFNPQGIGSAITYGRRYSLAAILGIASEDDDDGNTGSQGEENSTKRKKNFDVGAITPTIRAKYKMIFGKEEGVEAFVAHHKNEAEQKLTIMIQERFKEGQANA